MREYPPLQVGETVVIVNGHNPIPQHSAEVVKVGSKFAHLSDARKVDRYTGRPKGDYYYDGWWAHREEVVAEALERRELGLKIRQVVYGYEFWDKPTLDQLRQMAEWLA